MSIFHSSCHSSSQSSFSKWLADDTVRVRRWRRKSCHATDTWSWRTSSNDSVRTWRIQRSNIHVKFCNEMTYPHCMTFRTVSNADQALLNDEVRPWLRMLDDSETSICNLGYSALYQRDDGMSPSILDRSVCYICKNSRNISSWLWYLSRQVWNCQEYDTQYSRKCHWFILQQTFILNSAVDQDSCPHWYATKRVRTQKRSYLLWSFSYACVLSRFVPRIT